MGSEWTTIGAIAEVFDGPHATPTKIDEGPYFLSISSLENGKLDLSKSARISEKQFVKWTKRVTPQDGDVLFSYETRLGEAALMPAGVTACLGRRMGLLRPDRNKVDPRFLLFAYLSPTFQQEIRTRTNYGATVERIALKELPDFPIQIPSLREQQAIAHILGSLDDKIELNRRMNATLEAMAQALFKSWFVDFDPVIDNALAAGHPIPEPLQSRAKARAALGDQRKPLPEAIQQQFPNRFVFNEDMGWVPEGWETVNLANLATKISKGTTPRKNDIIPNGHAGEVPFIKVKDITNEGQININGLDKIPRGVHEGVLKRSILMRGDILFSIAGTIGRCSIVPKELNDSNTNQAVAFVRPKSTRYTYFIFQFLQSKEIQDIVLSRVVHAVQANFSLTELGGLKLSVPSLPSLEYWDESTKPILQKIELLRRKSNHLANLRDTLLPKLLSGQLRIPEAEQQVANML